MAYLIALIGAWFGFANPVLQIPILVLLFPCALIWLGTTADSSGHALKRGWLTGLLVYGSCLYWVVLPVHHYGPLPWILALPCPVLLGAVLGAFTAVFAFLLHWANLRLAWWGSGLFAGAVWAALELARSMLLTGFPWLSLPQALSPWPLALQSLKLMGAFCFSGVLVLVSAWLVHGLKRAAPLVAACLIVSAIYAYGAYEMDRPPQAAEAFSASIVQGNIDQNRKWDRAFQKATLDRYMAMSRQEIESHDPDLLLWPETALPFYLQESSEHKERLREFLKARNQPLLTGSPGYEYVHKGGSEKKQLAMFNRAYLLDPRAQTVDVYEKEHLVPFGEYVPLKGLLPFLDSLVPGDVDFSPGRRTAPLELHDLAMGVLICYEVIFPDLAQKRVSEGANVLINLSNDAWFGRSSAAAQHLHQAVLRALEQSRYLLRSTNTGISAVIDPQGRIVDRTPLFQESALYHQGIGLAGGRSFFSSHFAAFTVLPPVLGGILLLLAGLKPEKRAPGKEKPRFRP